jgi:hypothetical protein
LIASAALGLKIRSAGTPDFGTFVPVDSQPAETVENRRQRLLQIALLIGIVDSQHELTAVLPREEPVK